ncbi:MAG: tetratricopeptide repeat protein [Desulfovibrio sp.]|nr:tetratricopeptide repeat protein [Desulfovibrio sp.]
MKKHSSQHKTQADTTANRAPTGYLSKRFVILAMAFSLVLGLVIGSLLANLALEQTQALPKAASKPAENPQSNGPQLSAADQQTLSKLEQAAHQNPKNQENWVNLGNAYFDAQRPDAAIRAYETAVSLGAHSPDLLTDLGIMYRQLQRFEDALLSFQQAKALDPTHLQSRLNEGIVLYYDLHLKDAALQAWKEALQINAHIHMSNGEPLASLVERLEKTP